MGTRLYLGYNGEPPLFFGDSSKAEHFVGKDIQYRLMIEKEDREAHRDPLIRMLFIEEEKKYIVMTALCHKIRGEIKILSYEFVKAIADYVEEEKQKRVIIMKQVIDTESKQIYEVIYHEKEMKESDVQARQLICEIDIDSLLSSIEKSIEKAPLTKLWKMRAELKKSGRL